MELLGLVVVLLVALATVLFFTRGVFARDLTSALKRVNQQEQALQEKADILEQRIHQMERDYQAKVKRAETEAEHMIEDAKREAINIRTAAIEEAKFRARQLIVEAEQGRIQLKTEVARELDGKAIQRACDTLRMLLPADLLTALHEALIRELVATLPHLETHASPQEVERIEVVTAQPLASTSIEQLTRWIASLGATAPLHVEIDAGLVAGGLVRVGATTVDNSLANRLGQRRVM